MVPKNGFKFKIPLPSFKETWLVYRYGIERKNYMIDFDFVFTDPSFPDSFYSFSIDENNVEGCYVGVVRAVDRDVGDNAELRYFLQPFHTHFQIDPISGKEMEIVCHGPH